MKKLLILAIFFVIVEDVRQVPCERWGIHESTGTRLCVEKQVMSRTQWKDKVSADQAVMLLKTFKIPARVEKSK